MTERDPATLDETDDPINPQRDYEPMLMRLVWMIAIGVLLSMAQTLLGLIAVVQFLIMLFNKREPNETLAEFGETMGVWMAKAICYVTASSEVKPWPWTRLD